MTTHEDTDERGTTHRVGDVWELDGGRRAAVTRIEPRTAVCDTRIALDERLPAHIGWWVGQGWSRVGGAHEDALQRIAKLLEVPDASPRDVYLAVRLMAYEHARMRSELMRIVDAADQAREMLDGFEGAR